jgi:hypothetical protein
MFKNSSSGGFRQESEKKELGEIQPKRWKLKNFNGRSDKLRNSLKFVSFRLEALIMFE